MNPDDYESLPTSNIVTHMSAGAIAGIMEHCIMYPLDSVKTRMQSLTSSTGGISETFLRMIRHEGLLRPVRGMSVMVFGAGPSHAVYFSSYEFVKNALHSTSSSNFQPVVYGVAGSVSTILHDAIMNPAEVIKQRMQMSNSPYKSVLHCLVKTYKTEGIKAFYRSYTTQMMMNIPFQSTHFVCYELGQKITNKEGKYNPLAHMVSGAMAGGIAAAITTPLDVCKTLLNTQQGSRASGLIQAVKTVYRLGGLSGFFRGVQARVMHQMPSTAICWSTYEFFKYILGASDVRIVPTGSVLAEEETEPPRATKSDCTGETRSLKPIDIPSLSGAGLYGSVSYNTLHTTDSNFKRKDSVIDILHT